jgi:hypothetical protein
MGQWRGRNERQTTRTFRFGPNFTINKTHSLVGNFNYSDSSTENSGVGGLNLPERASNQKGHNFTIQMTERANFSARLTNEFRFQMRQNNSGTVPVTAAMAINVTDSFNGGGAQNRRTAVPGLCLLETQRGGSRRET